MTGSILVPPDPAVWRTLLEGEMPHAHEALLALFGGIEEADVGGALAALDQLAAVGDRLHCPDLAAWCRSEGRHAAERSLESFVAGLPQLLELWEQAQDAVIARAFPRPRRYVLRE